MHQSPPQEIKLHALDYLRIIRVRWPIVLLVFLLITITAMVVTYFAPRKYASTATMQVKAADFFMNLFGSSSSPNAGTAGGPGFANTQNEIIQRTEVLYPVVESLQLIQRWAPLGVTNKRDAYLRLRSLLQIKAILNTDLIEITATTLSPKESAEIANAVAEAYKNKRIDEVKTWLNRSLSTLEGEVETQRQAVGRLQGDAARIRRQKNITDLNPDTVEEASGTKDRALIEIEQQL
ncbi:MAG TPA: Wzz/FepE/Etk N-terminal domain-containing protein, partial [Chthoniobacterales bacterium]